MALFNPAYTQFINQRVPQAQQPQQRAIGFGNNFKDTPPTFITEKKEDNNRNVMLSNTGGLTRDIVADPNQNKRNFIGNVSAFQRRAMLSSGGINKVFRTEGK